MIKVFSRDGMINHIKCYGILSNEYYISILPDGGPKSTPVFKENYPNVITLIFSDVLVDCIKTQYPDGTGLRFARAMTKTQADELCAFIKSIPTNATINIHCVYGKSRSVAIGLAIENKEFNSMCNKHVYTLIKERLHK